jgi:predicted nucleic acid-binding protein
MNDIVISDTTALIILAKSDAFALLSNLFQKIYIPQAVYDELMFKDDIVNYRIKAFDNIELKPVSDMATLERIKRLKIDKGEVEAISLALELNLMLIIDERKGRKIAINQGLKIVGVLGILIANYRKKFLTHDEVKLKFLLFKEQGLRISEQLEKLFFEKLDE